MEAGDPAEWLLHSESDLRYATPGRGAPGILQNQVAFHAQQAAEKALNAVLVHASIDFPRTHDLQALLMRIRDSGLSVQSIRFVTAHAKDAERRQAMARRRGGLVA
jgi:HEPN domain-containing protein